MEVRGNERGAHRGLVYLGILVFCLAFWAGLGLLVVWEVSR
jgi:hypothetical protein